MYDRIGPIGNTHTQFIKLNEVLQGPWPGSKILLFPTYLEFIFRDSLIHNKQKTIKLTKKKFKTNITIKN